MVEIQLTCDPFTEAVGVLCKKSHFQDLEGTAVLSHYLHDGRQEIWHFMAQHDA